MDPNLLSSPTHGLVLSRSRARSSHVGHVSQIYPRCSAEELGALRRLAATVTRCKGCGCSIGRWVDYCADCTGEDETDCW